MKRHYNTKGRTPRFDDPVREHYSPVEKNKSMDFAKKLLAKDLERWKLLFAQNKYQKPLDQ
jgi:hypothetical protein